MELTNQKIVDMLQTEGINSFLHRVKFVEDANSKSISEEESPKEKSPRKNLIKRKQSIQVNFELAEKLLFAQSR